MRPQALDSDAADGFLTWQSMQRGAPWNHFVMVEPADLAQEQLRFTAWWSPGQWVVPSLLVERGLTLGQAVGAVSVASIGLGLIGYFQLFLALGVPVTTSRLAVTLMSASTIVAGELRTYSGGETLVFGATPWIVLAAVRTLSWPRFRRLVLLIPLFLAGMFLKLSFFITAIAIMCSLSLVSVRRQQALTKTALLEACTVGGVAVLLYATMFFSFLRFGDYQAPHGLDISLLSLLHPAAGGLLAAAGIGEIAGGWDERTLTTVAGLAAAALLHVALIGWLATVRPLEPAYRAFAIGFAMAYAAALLWSYVLVVGVNHGNRHFRAAGFMLLPALLTWIGTTRIRTLRAAAIAILVIGAAAGPVTYAATWRRHGSGAVGVHGVTQAEVSPAVLQVVHSLDRWAPSDAVFGVPSATLSLELARLRSLEVIGEDVHGYRGRVSNVFMLMTDDAETEAKLALLSDYARHQWRTYALDGATLHVQGASSDDDLARWLGGAVLAPRPTP